MSAMSRALSSAKQPWRNSRLGLPRLAKRPVLLPAVAAVGPCWPRSAGMDGPPPGYASVRWQRTKKCHVTSGGKSCGHLNPSVNTDGWSRRQQQRQQRQVLQALFLSAPSCPAGAVAAAAAGRVVTAGLAVRTRGGSGGPCCGRAGRAAALDPVLPAAVGPAAQSAPASLSLHKRKTGAVVSPQQRRLLSRSTAAAAGAAAGPGGDSRLAVEPGDVIGGRYTVQKVLGRGGFGVTYGAETEDGEEVALKVLSLRRMKAWKDLELFEREARVLKSLNHPGIPQYVDYFEEDFEDDVRFVLVQRLAPGKSLARLVREDGFRFSEDQVVDVARQVLAVLQYLEMLRPPVVHRDIKPENVIYDPVTQKVQLVDFGGVQEAAAMASADSIGTTVVGTYGYMAPEQFQSRATTQSDIYSLGATLLFLLSGGTPPSSFGQTRLRIDFRSAIPSLSPRLANIVSGMVEPAPEDRFRKALDVLAALDGRRPMAAAAGGRVGDGQGGALVRGTPGFVKKKGGQRDTREYEAEQDGDVLTKPAGSKVDVERTPGRLTISVPPAGLNEATIGSGSFAIAWNAFVAFWTASAATAGAPLLFTAFSIPFWVVGLGLARNAVSSVAVSTTIEIGRDEFRVKWRVGGGLWEHEVAGETGDISGIDIPVLAVQNGEPVTAVRISEGVRTHDVGGGLQFIEQMWIAAQICDFLGLRFRRPDQTTMREAAMRMERRERRGFNDEDEY